MTTFKAGDRVRFKEGDRTYIVGGSAAGTREFTIRTIGPSGALAYFEGGEGSAFTRRLEHVPAAPKAGPAPVSLKKVTATYRSLEDALVDAGGVEEVAERMQGMTFIEAFDILARNDIRFVYMGR